MLLAVHNSTWNCWIELSVHSIRSMCRTTDTHKRSMASPITGSFEGEIEKTSDIERGDLTSVEPSCLVFTKPEKLGIDGINSRLRFCIFASQQLYLLSRAERCSRCNTYLSIQDQSDDNFVHDSFWCETHARGKYCGSDWETAGLLIDIPAPCSR